MSGVKTFVTGGGGAADIHVPSITVSTINVSTLKCLYAVGYKTRYFLRGAEQYGGAGGGEGGCRYATYEETLCSKDEHLMRPAMVHMVSETSRINTSHLF